MYINIYKYIDIYIFIIIFLCGGGGGGGVLSFYVGSSYGYVGFILWLIISFLWLNYIGLGQLVNISFCYLHSIHNMHGSFTN